MSHDGRGIAPLLLVTTNPGAGLSLESLSRHSSRGRGELLGDRSASRSDSRWLGSGRDGAHESVLGDRAWMLEGLDDEVRGQALIARHERLEEHMSERGDLQVGHRGHRHVQVLPDWLRWPQQCERRRPSTIVRAIRGCLTPPDSSASDGASRGKGR